MSFFSGKRFLIGVTVVFTLIISSWAIVTAVETNNETFYAMVNKSSGILKITTADAIPEENEYKIQWNQKGEQGIQGIQGEKGDKGDTGEQGIQGEKGEPASDEIIQDLLYRIQMLEDKLKPTPTPTPLPPTLTPAPPSPTPIPITPTPMPPTPTPITIDMCVDPSKAISSGWYADREPSRAFDDVYTNNYGFDSWEAPSPFLPHWIGYDFTTPKVIQKYVIYMSSYPASSPISWAFQGSNDSTNWVNVHTVSNEPNWTAYSSRAYTFTNSNSFRYYRLFITELQTNDHPIISELEMMEQ